MDDGLRLIARSDILNRVSTSPPFDGHRSTDRPALLPGLACVVRDDDTLQLGIEPPHALVLTGAGSAHSALLRAMDGRYDRAALEDLADSLGLRPGTLDDLLTLLTSRGLLIDSAPRARLVGRLDVNEVARLSPDISALALRHTEPGGSAWDTARAAIVGRADAWVEVHGAGRVGAGAAALLAAAGVGRVTVVDAERCRPADVSPLGLHRQAVGLQRRIAAQSRLGEVSKAARTSPAPEDLEPDLCLLTPDAGQSALLAAAWVRRAEPHLVAYVRETVGVVGPLVLPGRTACLHCLDLHRRDHDPSWARVATQLADGVPGRACDVALATLIAAQAALQVLAYLDGDPVTALEATLETLADGSVVRRRSWSPHPACGCQWATDVRSRSRTDGGPTQAGRTAAPRSATMGG